MCVLHPASASDIAADEPLNQAIYNNQSPMLSFSLSMLQVRAHALAALDCFVKLLRDAHAETSAAARAEGDTAKAGLPGAVPLDCIFHVRQ